MCNRAFLRDRVSIENKVLIALAAPPLRQQKCGGIDAHLAVPRRPPESQRYFIQTSSSGYIRLLSFQQLHTFISSSPRHISIFA
ncbi:hypothetical protein D3C73_1571940 [compost metagenome]